MRFFFSSSLKLPHIHLLSIICRYTNTYQQNVSVFMYKPLNWSGLGNNTLSTLLVHTRCTLRSIYGCSILIRFKLLNFVHFENFKFNHHGLKATLADSDLHANRSISIWPHKISNLLSIADAGRYFNLEDNIDKYKYIVNINGMKRTILIINVFLWWWWFVGDIL